MSDSDVRPIPAAPLPDDPQPADSSATDELDPPGGEGGVVLPKGPKLFGTFAGVFTPTLLTILGVIMYLRLGWVVGNAGLLGGLLIIALANGITLCTGLSLSSIATNTRLGAGGPYAIISKSLGFEIGGSVGVPLYLSQGLAVAMYVFGFREGWVWVFPDHPAILVDLVIFGVVFVIAYLSASLAFKIQYVVMAVIGLSLVSIFAAPDFLRGVGGEVQLWGSYPGAPEDGFRGTSFWLVFAVFFPAATGVMAGANMSGELKNPRKSIPLGTLSAIGVSLVIYVLLTVWTVRAATPEELVSNYTVMIDKALWGPIVLAGLLGATFSSALTSLVGAPRIMQALGKDGLVPGGGWLAKTTQGEPRRAMLVTGVIVLAALLLRDLNVIAPMITMFFLITYAVINVVMLAEASLGLMSFRPTFELPRLVPLLGALGCVFAMFIVNPTFGLLAVAVVVGIYFWITWRGIAPRTGTVRSGIFAAFAEWAAGKVIALEMTASRAWKPSLLVPVLDPATLRGELRLLIDVCRPEGSVKLLGVATTETVDPPHPAHRAARADAPQERRPHDELGDRLGRVRHRRRDGGAGAAQRVLRPERALPEPAAPPRATRRAPRHREGDQSARSGRDAPRAPRGGGAGHEQDGQPLGPSPPCAHGDGGLPRPLGPQPRHPHRAPAREGVGGRAELDHGDPGRRRSAGRLGARQRAARPRPHPGVGALRGDGGDLRGLRGAGPAVGHRRDGAAARRGRAGPRVRGRDGAGDAERVPLLRLVGPRERSRVTPRPPVQVAHRFAQARPELSP